MARLYYHGSSLLPETICYSRVDRSVPKLLQYMHSMNVVYVIHLIFEMKNLPRKFNMFTVKTRLLTSPIFKICTLTTFYPQYNVY